MTRYKGGGLDRLHRPPFIFFSMAETKYNKDYSAKTAEEWLSERKWTGFLMRLPLRSSKDYPVENANDAMSIRATASMLTNNENCDRRFSVTINFEESKVIVTANKK